MPKDKTLSHEKVIKAAREEFLEKGFNNASMRSIGLKAGMTPAGLYRHYKNKEDMFDDLVKPTIDEIEKWYKHHVETSYSQIDNNAPAQELFGSTMIDFVKEVIYPNKDGFNLMLKCSKGTKYENFVHDMVKRQQDDFLEALNHMRQKGISVKNINKEEMHIIMSAYTTALLEPFMHNMDEQQTEHCLKIIDDFFMPGWQKIMGF